MQSAEPRAAAAEADGDDDAAEMDHEPLGGEEAEAKDPDEKEGKEGKSERKEGKGKDKAKPDKVDPHAQAPDPRPPGVSRKKRKAKADADKGPPPKSPRKNSVKAATEALISRLDDKACFSLCNLLRWADQFLFVGQGASGGSREGASRGDQAQASGGRGAERECRINPTPRRRY